MAHGPPAQRSAWEPFDAGRVGSWAILGLLVGLPPASFLPHPFLRLVLLAGAYFVFLCSLARGAQVKRWSLSGDALALALGVVVFWAFASALFALDRHAAVLSAGQVLAYALLALAAGRQAREDTFAARAAWAVAAGGAFVAGATLLAPHGPNGELVGPLGGANAAAAYFLLSGPLTAALVVRGGPQRGLAALSLVLQAACFALCRSRGAFFGAGVALGVLLALRWPGRRTLRRAAGLGLALALLAAGGALFFAELSPQSSSLEHRLFIWRAGLRIVAQRPAVGAGPGNFARAFRHSRPEYLGNSYVLAIAQDAHNELLHTAAELGAPGAVAAAAAFALALAGAWRRAATEDKPLAIAVAWAIGAWGANGMVNCSLHQPAVAATLAVLVGLGWARRGESAGETPFAPRPWLRWALVIAAAVALGGLGARAVRHAAARTYAARGDYTRALRWDGGWSEAALGYAREVGDAAPQAAERVLRAALARTPKDPELHHAYAVVAARLGEERAACAHLAAAAELDPFNPYFQRDLARALLREGKRSEARQALARAVRLFELTLEVAEARYGPQSEEAAGVREELRAARALLSGAGDGKNRANRAL